MLILLPFKKFHICSQQKVNFHISEGRGHKGDKDGPEGVTHAKNFTLKELSEIFHDISGKKIENVRSISKHKKEYYNSPCCLKYTLLSLIYIMRKNTSIVQNIQ